MSAEIIELRHDDHLGLCPTCKRPPKLLNVERVHFGTCAHCRTKWIVGENLFSSWTHETTEDWEANAQKLKAYKIQDPFFWSRSNYQESA